MGLINKKTIMKTINTKFLKTITLLALCFFAFYGCSKDENEASINPEAADINAYILGLSYNQDVLLNVQETGGAASERTVTNEYPTSDVNQGTVFACNVKDYNLESNFDDVAILRPTNGVIFPGALVVGNQGMLDGAPDPIAIDRSPVTLRLDLPGIGDQGNIVVDNPSNSSVQSSIDNALEYWNDSNNYNEDGYVNAAQSTYQAATSYSSTQHSLDIGLNAAWATGSVAAQMEYETTSTTRVASMVFKQVFYSVTMDTPESNNPASVFGTSVSLSDVESIMNAEDPPAYVHSVSYGRIIMMRMETNNTNTSIGLDAVLEYAGGVNASGTINYDYEEVLSNSTINIITIGGNAEVAVSAVDGANIDEGPGSLNYIITGDNAIYTRDNPGLPIGYSIRYLQGNSLAKMGYTTDYTVEECGSSTFSHDEVTVENDSYHDIRFYFRYKAQNTNFVYNSPTYEVNQGDVRSRFPPSGSHDVEVNFEYQYGAGGWNFIDDYQLNYVYSEKCYRLYGGSITGAPSQVTTTSCN
jgi:hypothetical protein